MIRFSVCLSAVVCGCFGQYVPPAGSSPTFPTNPQTATYQVLASDFAACKTITVASGTFTVTLVASNLQPAAGQCIWVGNYGSGIVTIARSGQNINGGTSSLTLSAASATATTGAFIVSDGTNYEAQTFTTGAVSSVAGLTGAVPGGLVLQEQHAASGATELDFTTCVSSSYDDYELDLLNMTASTSTAILYWQAYANGAYDTGSNYQWGIPNLALLSSQSAGANGSSSDAGILLGVDNHGLLSTATPALQVSLRMYNLNTAGSYATIAGQGVSVQEQNGIQYLIQPAGVYKVSTYAVTAFRLKLSGSGTFSGTARCYGIAKQ